MKDKNPAEIRRRVAMYQNYIFDLYGTLADLHTVGKSIPTALPSQRNHTR